VAVGSADEKNFSGHQRRKETKKSSVISTCVEKNFVAVALVTREVYDATDILQSTSELCVCVCVCVCEAMVSRDMQSLYLYVCGSIAFV
jgi:hypothetical protein